MRRIPFFIFLAVLFPGALVYGRTGLWLTRSYQDYKSSERRGIALLTDGRLMLGRKLSLVADLNESFAWDIVPGPGGSIYVATGSNGRVFRVARDGKVTVVGQVPGTQALSLARSERGGLFVGTNSGDIYRLVPGKEPRLYFSTGEDYVWSLVFDPRGNLLAATGVNGKIFTIDPTGRGKCLLDTRASNIMDLAVSGDGQVFAATEGKSLVMRIGAGPRAFTLYSSPLDEVHTLAFDDRGNLYAAAMSIGLTPSLPRIPSVRRPKQGETGLKGQNSTQGEVRMSAPEPQFRYQPTPPPGVSLGRKSEIYRISPAGMPQVVWSWQNDLVYSILYDGDGRLLAGTASEGKIFLVDPRGNTTEVADLDEKQVLSLLGSPEGTVFIGTGSRGKIYRMEKGHPETGVITSPVHDAGLTSTWGRLTWEGDIPPGTVVKFQTRVGNTEEPDETWTPWSKQSSLREFPLKHPPARFVQWRATMESDDRGSTPVIRSVCLAYRQENYQPRIRSLEVMVPEPFAGGGGVNHKLGSRGKSSQGQNRRNSQAPFAGQEGYLIQWSADDPNGDQLVFDLQFRGLGERNWKLIEKDIEDQSYTWQTDGVPDGRYEVRLVASDRRENPPGVRLTDTRVSLPFTVDNTPPRVFGFSWEPLKGGGKVSCRVEDNFSPVYHAEYSVDAGDWVTVGSVDGVFDSRSERVEIVLSGLEPGEHTVVVKAVDALGNSGAGKTVIRVAE